MDIQSLQKHFGRIGARVKIGNAGVVREREQTTTIDVSADAEGEYFDLQLGVQDKADFLVVNAEPKMKHLLLMARRQDGNEKFLCGQDERHWFVSAVPNEGVTTVKTAFEALQPLAIRRLVRSSVRPKNRYRRRNEVFVRQGEWFFVPQRWINNRSFAVLRNEPISRGNGSKPHMCESLYRLLGQEVMVCAQYPYGVDLQRYEDILRSRRGAKNWNWTQMRRGAAVFVAGRVWHPDHKTIVLDGWHQVLINTAGQASGSQSVAFLD